MLLLRFDRYQAGARLGTWLYFEDELLGDVLIKTDRSSYVSAFDETASRLRIENKVQTFCTPRPLRDAYQPATKCPETPCLLQRDNVRPSRLK